MSLARIANTLVETYLGRTAGRRVLQGCIARGVADRIKTVLWFSDLHNYTRISDSAPPEEIIPFLNGYADAIVTADPRTLTKDRTDWLRVPVIGSRQHVL